MPELTCARIFGDREERTDKPHRTTTSNHHIEPPDHN